MPILELELERQRRFTEDVAWLRKTFLPSVNARQASLFLLRILFNQVVGRKDDAEDAVFCVSPSPLTLPQIDEDLKYKNITNVGARELLDQVLRRWSEHAAALRVHKATRAFTVTLRKDELHVWEQRPSLGKAEAAATTAILYVADVNSLGRKFPSELERLAALHIRYRYIGLDYQGAARDFAGLGYKADDTSVIEGFASALNHYFHRYCSAFPDLEKAFGSMGSFWTIATQPQFWQPATPSPVRLIVNPPPNAAIAEYVVRLLPLDTTMQVSMTFPYWKDATALNKMLELHPRTQSFHVHTPKTIEFINHMRDGGRREWNGNPVLEWTTTTTSTQKSIGSREQKQPEETMRRAEVHA
jgi:hypothetical protein